MANGTFSMRASVRASSVLPQPVGPTSRMFDFSISTSLSFPFASDQPLVVVVHGHGQHFLARSWPITYWSRFATISRGVGILVNSCLVGAAAPLFLVENRLAQLDALAADVNVTGSFHQRADVAIALAAERTERRSSFW
jgi:hypothetical protein